MILRRCGAGANRSAFTSPTDVLVFLCGHDLFDQNPRWADFKDGRLAAPRPGGTPGRIGAVPRAYPERYRTTAAPAPNRGRVPNEPKTQVQFGI